MYASIRRYRVSAGQTQAVAQRAREGFLPDAMRLPGFRGYLLLDAGNDTGIAISLYRDRASAEDVNQRAARWVRDNIGTMVREGPDLVGTGEVLIEAIESDDAEAIGRVARTTLEAFNSRDLDRGAAVIAEGARFRDMATGEELIGPEGYRQNMKRWLRAFPDGKVEIVSVTVGGETAVVQFIGRGTNTGPLAGPGGELPPTGRTSELSFCDVMTIRGGRILEGRTYYDFATMLRQLGLAPALTAPLNA